ncbi:GH36-type glycosyl hydrolase domain-containing protein [Anaerotruncus rubiinfantis]|uniref:GH36-type glycosyl hydrolase domain-containing protein n=1 Tax=Anaerotruncus rubiinfantis TaxID=1720200 RepID=UPI001897FAB5|nr:glucoamylase family protein [Anaerotruncus rubiinfantis]
MKEIEKVTITEKVEGLFSQLSEHRNTVAGIRRELCKNLDVLRESFAALRETGAAAGWQQWLSDNFYALEGHAKQSMNDLRGYRKNSVPLASLYFILRGVFADAVVPLTQENTAEALGAANRLQELGERQFGFVYPALKCTLIAAAAMACSPNLADEERERRISFAVVGLSQLYEIDFAELTEQCSTAEEILLEDPSGVYPKMARQSKRYYREIAARIAKKSGAVESAVARDVVEYAKKSDGERTSHVGYYLLEKDPQAKKGKLHGAAALAATWIVPVFLCALCGFCWDRIFLPVLLYLPLVEIVRIFACDLAMRGIPARHIPRMRLGGEAPRTVVVISTLLPAPEKARDLAKRLEQLYFSNKGEHLRFCVLADFKEDRRPYHPQDAVQIGAAKKVVEELNACYGNRFMLFVRRRSFCPTQDRYCGWERKRGAITEFVRFLNGSETSVSCFVGDRAALSEARFLIALDSDTNLLFDTADVLISAAMHPLNRPVVGKNQVVTAGYGIFVPAIGTELDSAKETDFTRIMAGAGGISTYEQESNDFYQDLFGEAIFSGKGLIDIEAFRTVVGHRFPENALLSHDILEGAYLRTALISDVEMTDGMPASALSWFSRLHRWIRGDWQNLRFIGKRFSVNGIKRVNPIGGLSRYKMLDNLRRSLTPVAAVLLVAAAGLARPDEALWLCAAAFLSVSLAPLLAALRAFLAGGRFALTRRYFARTLPRVFELAGQALLSFVMAAQQAVVTLDAVFRTLWRMLVSRKNLLQWTTAAQGELREVSFSDAARRSWISELLGLLLLIFAPRTHLIVKLCGGLFLLYAPLAVMTARRTVERHPVPDPVQRERILSWCAQMFRFYEDYANEENHFLPPDNVQFSPKKTVARRTSPTNIGMMLLSLLAARDFHLLDSRELYLRLDRTFETVESLETFHGNLYNWYATDDLRVLPDGFISAVDSGNYLCALVALRQGVLEYAPQEPLLREIAQRIEKILQGTDLSIFYNRRRRLFSIGVDQNGNQVGSHYDFLMSEARTLSYYAIATRQASRKHWRALNRTMSRSGVYAGPVSWTGTMFEYFMPHLLLPVYEGSLLGEAMQYAIYCQKKRARQAGVPWGISESGYFAFDEALNYQYKAHGVQKLGVKQGLDRELVVAPYASFLTLPFDPDASMQNLERLERMGITGQYGFYEAADFTPVRVPQGERYAIVRSYMAHHVGMSMIACANALLGNVMQKRFMRDHAMAAARDFLQEKIAKDAVVYDQMKPENNERTKSAPKENETISPPVSALSPKAALLANGVMSHAFSSTGVSFLRYGDNDVTRRSRDALLHGQGILSVLRMNGETVAASEAPFYQSGVERHCTFGPEFVSFSAKAGTAELEQRFTLDGILPVSRCDATVRNHTGNKAVAELLFYFEPVLSRESEYAAHPAFSKLFVLGERDAATDTIHFLRRHRDCTDGLHLSVGFEQTVEYNFSLRREEVTPYPDGLAHLLRFDTAPLTGKTATPDGCCALRVTLVVPAHGEETVGLLLSCAPTQAESIGNLLTIRDGGRTAAQSLFLNRSITGRIGMEVLPDLLFGAEADETQQKALAENSRGQDALWSLGISGDLPIVVFDWEKKPDEACLLAYAEFWQAMKLHRLDFDLCVLGRPELALPQGVRKIDPAAYEPELVTALRAAACHTAGAERNAGTIKGFSPMAVLHTSPLPIPQEEGRFDLVGGAYVKGRFYVERVTPLPFSHILANRNFGTLLHDCGLGNTWWQNARECRLTPWQNDIATGNDGERMLLRIGEEIYDLCCGARASFSPAGAWYDGMAGGIRTKLQVQVAETESLKIMDVTLQNDTDEEVEIICAYVIEPVLGVSRLTAKYTQFTQENGCLTLHNPYTMELPAYAAVCTPGEHPSYTVDRTAFWSGDWSARELLPNNDPIAGTVVRKRLPPRRREKIRFILAAAAKRDAAVKLATGALPPSGGVRPGISIATPDLALNHFVNGFLPHQVVAGRLFGRCAFYQCSGAYGFRDQLQDAAACLLIDPELTKEQILRCCAAQFPEGDVLHWWHDLPGGVRGVRTTFSDDLVWLPLVVCDYLKATGDESILSIPVAYCEGEPLGPGEQERYQRVHASAMKEEVFFHCVRAIEHACNLGDKGIPKIGCGDWNDGFSNIGTQGKGQSVWLGMFLAIVFDRFAPILEARGDSYRASVFRGNAENLRGSIDQNCWDGGWYLRAFFDDGTPVGSRENSECRIDLLAQSFSVFCGMPDNARVMESLDAARKRLVDDRGQIIKLFTPPFDQSTNNPGYIKAYPIGIRENGGQYTHGAIWFAMAMLEAGRTDEGYRLLSYLNPAGRCTDAGLAQAFKTEPYYMPADIYTHRNCYGHGGWSIYTGAAGWYYRAVVETLLGIRFCGDHLEVFPRLPEGWTRFSAQVRRSGYEIELEVMKTGVESITVDGTPAGKIPLDGKNHNVLLTF